MIYFLTHFTQKYTTNMIYLGQYNYLFIICSRHSFIYFHTHFSSGERHRATALWQLEIPHSWQQSRDCSAGSIPRQDQASSEMWSCQLVLGGPLGHFPVGVASRTCLANNFWDILITWPNQHCWDLSNQKSWAQYSELYKFHSCTIWYDKVSVQNYLCVINQWHFEDC